jgi:oxygen-independent coproporphyrinogen-3 oxidase
MLRTHAGAPLRFATSDNLDAYLEGPDWDEPRRLNREEEMEEAWFLGLRLNEGVSLGALRSEFSASAVREFLSTIGELEGDGLIAFADGDRVALTARGRLLSNDVFGRFLVEPVVA